jgi:hypothetical protein
MIAAYILVGLVLVLFISWLILPGKNCVYRSILVDAPMEKVFGEVNDLRCWEIWSPWFLVDPTQKIKYSIPSSGQGAFYQWESTNKMVDKGTLTLTEVDPGKRIVQELIFAKWEETKSTMLFEQTTDGIKVSWTMEVESRGIGKLLGPVMKKNLARQFKLGLAGIKREAEKPS